MMITRNRARCLKCDEIVESFHRHDMKWCGCGAIAVDGGRNYLKRALGADVAASDLEELVDTCRIDEAVAYRMPGKSNGTDDMTRRLQAALIPHRVELFNPSRPTVFDA